jgi:hypothetical protein
MPTILADYRTDLDNFLATAVDSSTWTTALKDEALRQALADLDGHLVYETTFTVVSAGYEQDLSAIPALYQVLALAYPWPEGARFEEHSCVSWRLTGPNRVYFEHREAQAGDAIRVRYAMRHAIDDLDAAAATTVPEQLRRTLVRGAAAYCCELRIRQLSENPAEPKEAPSLLRQLADSWRAEFHADLSRTSTRRHVSWSSIGLVAVGGWLAAQSLLAISHELPAISL